MPPEGHNVQLVGCSLLAGSVLTQNFVGQCQPMPQVSSANAHSDEVSVEDPKQKVGKK